MIELKPSEKICSKSFTDLDSAVTLDFEEGQKRSIAKQYESFDGKVFEVELNKGESGIGLSIMQGKGSFSDTIFIIEVKPESPAFLDGRIQKGDEILEVNGTPVKGLLNHHATEILRNVENHVRLVIGHPQNLKKFDSIIVPETPAAKMKMIHEYHTIILHKTSAGLGFAIGEGYQRWDNASGIFILNVTEGGTAYQDGRLEIGDEIIAINQHSLSGLTQLEAVSIIHAVEGQVVIEVSREVEVPVVSYESTDVKGESKENNNLAQLDFVDSKIERRKAIDALLPAKIIQQ